MWQNYEAKGFSYGNHYVWRKVTFYATPRGIAYTAPAKQDNAWAIGKTGEVEHTLSFSDSYDKTPLQVAQDGNASYAKQLQKAADDLTRYIGWQQNRIKTWKLAECVPVAFKPTRKVERLVEFEPAQVSL